MRTYKSPGSKSITEDSVASKRDEVPAPMKIAV